MSEGKGDIKYKSVLTAKSFCDINYILTGSD